MNRSLTFKDAALFFVPLIFWAQLMMITHSVIHGWLARDAFPTLSIAGFSIAFSFNALMSSAFRAFHPITISFGTDRASLGRITLVGGMMAVASTGFILLVSLTPLGDWIYGGLLSASPAVVAEARKASFLLAWIFPLQMLRNVAAGLLMRHRRTMWIASGTLLRLISLVGWLTVLATTLRGASLGAAALLLCIVVEAGFVVLFALPLYRETPTGKGEPARYGELWRFSWPVILNSMLENAMVVVINGFLGRVANPDQALAAFGVTRGLLMVMMSPLRNLAQTAQAIAHTAEDLPKIKRFSLLTSAVFTAIILLVFYTPVKGLILGQMMGLPAALRTEMNPGLLMFALLPLLWSGAALYRGLISGAGKTGALAGTGFVRLGAVFCVSAVVLVWPQVNGAMVGVLALGAAFGAEAIMLWFALRTLIREGSAYPPKTPDPGLNAAA